MVEANKDASLPPAWQPVDSRCRLRLRRSRRAQSFRASDVVKRRDESGHVSGQRFPSIWVFGILEVSSVFVDPLTRGVRFRR